MTTEIIPRHSRPPLDGCPECAERNQAPIGESFRDSRGVTAYYRCRYCLHSWYTAWATDEGA